MGIFDRKSGVPPSGKDLMWFDILDDDHNDGDGGGGGGCSLTGFFIAVGIVLGLIVAFVLTHSG